MGKPAGFKTIMIREELLERVRRVVNARIGYRSMAEFVSEAVRLRLDQVEPKIEKAGDTK